MGNLAGIAITIGILKHLAIQDVPVLTGDVIQCVICRPGNADLPDEQLRIFHFKRPLDLSEQTVDAGKNRGIFCKCTKLGHILRELGFCNSNGLLQGQISFTRNSPLVADLRFPLPERPLQHLTGGTMQQNMGHNGQFGVKLNADDPAILLGISLPLIARAE